MTNREEKSCWCGRELNGHRHSLSEIAAPIPNKNNPTDSVEEGKETKIEKATRIIESPDYAELPKEDLDFAWNVFEQRGLAIPFGHNIIVSKLGKRNGIRMPEGRCVSKLRNSRTDHRIVIQREGAKQPLTYFAGFFEADPLMVLVAPVIPSSPPTPTGAQANQLMDELHKEIEAITTGESENWEIEYDDWFKKELAQNSDNFLRHYVLAIKHFISRHIQSEREKGRMEGKVKEFPLAFQEGKKQGATEAKSRIVKMVEKAKEGNTDEAFSRGWDGAIEYIINQIKREDI